MWSLGLPFPKNRPAIPVRDQARWDGCCLQIKKDADMDSHGNTACTALPRAEVIAQLNDKLRKTGEGGTILITQNLRRVTGFSALALAAALANYDGFAPEHDPHGERDFGDLTLFGVDLLWKIDYYKTDLKFGSNDPANPEVTHRVLTVMLAMDW
jgi:hypothetical protein